MHEALELRKDRFGIGSMDFLQQFRLGVIKGVLIKIRRVNLIKLIDGNGHFGETIEKEFEMLL